MSYSPKTNVMVSCQSAASGMIIHKTTYIRRPVKPPPNRVMMTNIKRTSAGSMSRYAAKPPATPASILSSLERANFLSFIISYSFYEEKLFQLQILLTYADASAIDQTRQNKYSPLASQVNYQYVQAELGLHKHTFKLKWIERHLEIWCGTKHLNEHASL